MVNDIGFSIVYIRQMGWKSVHILWYFKFTSRGQTSWTLLEEKKNVNMFIQICKRTIS